MRLLAMRLKVVSLLCFGLSMLVAGCSTAPLCDFLDHVSPGRMEKDRIPPQGGVCAPGQGTIPIGGPPPALPLIPGPAPLPGSTGPPPMIPSINVPNVPPPPPPPSDG